MAIPDFIRDLRAQVGNIPLWLSGSTACIYRDGDGGVEWLLARRSDTGEWAPVTGIVDPGENPAETAVREALEEAGVAIEVERLIWLDVTDLIVYDNGDQTQYIDHIFRCRYVSGEPWPADGENTEVAFFGSDALPQMSRAHASALCAAIADAPECGLTPLPR